jgi:hypothetical protein
MIIWKSIRKMVGFTVVNGLIRTRNHDYCLFMSNIKQKGTTWIQKILCMIVNTVNNLAEHRLIYF